jgi:hypothetical protein
VRYPLAPFRALQADVFRCRRPIERPVPVGLAPDEQGGPDVSHIVNSLLDLSR